jgi:hypothetical protein
LQLSHGFIDGEVHCHGIQFGLQLVAFCFAVGRFLPQRCEAIFLTVELFGVPGNLSVAK